MVNPGSRSMRFGIFFATKPDWIHPRLQVFAGLKSMNLLIKDILKFN